MTAAEVVEEYVETCGCGYDSYVGHDLLAGFEARGIGGVLDVLEWAEAMYEWESMAPARHATEKPPPVMVPLSEWPDFVGVHDWAEREVVRDVISVVQRHVQEKHRTDAVERMWMFVLVAVSQVAKQSPAVAADIERCLADWYPAKEVEPSQAG